MENLRFTLFNGLTLLVMALALAVAAARLRGRKAWWTWLCYAAMLGYALAFKYSLNVYVLLVSAGFALLAPSRLYGRAARLGEFAVLAYVLVRSVALLLMW